MKETQKEEEVFPQILKTYILTWPGKMVHRVETPDTKHDILSLISGPRMVRRKQTPSSLPIDLLTQSYYLYLYCVYTDTKLF